MAINVTVDKKLCYQKFADKRLFESPPPGSPPASEDQLVEANIEVFPVLEESSPRRTVRWKVKAPILATEKNDEGVVLGVLRDLLKEAASVAPDIATEIGFTDALDILSQLARIGRSIRERLMPSTDHRIFRVDAFEVKFLSGTGTPPANPEGTPTGEIFYGYIVDAEARWLKDDCDDPLDQGTVICQELQDTNDVRAKGEPVTSGLDIITDKYRGPLLVSGPHSLSSNSTIQAELDVLATATVDTEVLPGIESFLTVVRAIELRVIAGTKDEVEIALNRARPEDNRQSKEVSQAVERASSRIAKAIVLASGSLSPDRTAASTIENSEVLRLMGNIAKGENSKVRSFLKDLPSARLIALANELGVTVTSDLESQIETLRGSIASRLGVS